MARMRKVTGPYIATTTGTSIIDGTEYRFYRGRTLVDADHPLLRVCPNNFKPTQDEVHHKAAHDATAETETREAGAAPLVA